MFSLKIDKDLIGKCLDEITFDKGDKLKVEYYEGDEKEEILTIKTIEHYNSDLFLITFEEQIGSYVYNLNQLIRFKVVA